MDVLREFRKEAPRESLDSLAALVRDFQWRFPRERRDMVVEWCRKAPNLKTAIDRAVLSKGEDGKHHNHQSKINRNAYTPMLAALVLERQKLKRAKDFDSLHDGVRDAMRAHSVTGWGPVGIYDIATRVGAYMGLEPTSLYLHAGVRMGWYELLQTQPGTIFNPRAWAAIERVPREHLPAEFIDLTADEVEDFLCTYRSVFSDCLAKDEDG